MSTFYLNFSQGNFQKCILIQKCILPKLPWGNSEMYPASFPWGKFRNVSYSHICPPELPRGLFRNVSFFRNVSLNFPQGKFRNVYFSEMYPILPPGEIQKCILTSPGGIQKCILKFPWEKFCIFKYVKPK
jgi:hypothetical protein